MGFSVIALLTKENTKRSCLLVGAHGCVGHIIWVPVPETDAIVSRVTTKVYGSSGIRVVRVSEKGGTDR